MSIRSLNFSLDKDIEVSGNKFLQQLITLNSVQIT